MQAKTKYLIVGVVGLVTVSGLLLYLQYKKMMNYVLSFKAIKPRKITTTLLSVDLYLNLNYKGDVPFEIVSQRYKVYVNNYLAANVTGKNSVQVRAGDNIIPINISFNPTASLKQIKTAEVALAALANQNTVKIKIEIEFFIRLLFFNISIPYTYNTTLKQMLTA